MLAPQIVYDAGALVAAERRRLRMWALHESALHDGLTPMVPTPVLVQVWRNGARQSNLARLLQGCQLIPLVGPTARAAGQLCGSASTSDVTDAVVAVVACAAPTVLVTSDPDDLTHLLAHAVGGDRVELFTV